MASGQYYDAKSYNKRVGITEEEESFDEEEEDNVNDNSEGEVETDADDEEEEMSTFESLEEELRAINSTIRNGFALTGILLIIILGVILYLLLHFTRFVLAP